MKKILVADDEENIRILYKEELEEDGYEVKVAGNGNETLALMNTFLPDLVILDIKMPDMNGLDILQHIRTMFRDLPVILSSAYPEYQQNLATWASDAYIVKSSNLANLKAAVKKILGE